MRLIIDLPNTEITGDIIRNGEWLADSLFDKVIRGAVKNATIIPENATNGDMIKALFPDCRESNIAYDDGIAYTYVQFRGTRIRVDCGLWNAPYEREVEE